jgi:hypothetical protein
MRPAKNAYFLKSVFKLQKFLEFTITSYVVPISQILQGPPVMDVDLFIEILTKFALENLNRFKAQ